MNKLTTNQNRLVVFSSNYDHVRGGEKYIYEIMSRVSQTRPVLLCVERISSYWRGRYTSLHIPIHILWRPQRFYWALLPLTLFINTFSLKKIILSTDTLFAVNFPLTFLATLLSQKTIVFCFEPLSIFYDRYRISRAPLKERVILTINRLCYASLDRVAIHRARILATLNSAVAKTVMGQFGRQPDVFIPNGVDGQFFSPSAPPLINNPSHRFFIIGHSTDYTPLKGTEALLRALPHVVAHHSRVVVLISESLPNKKVRARYKALIRTLNIEKNVRFVGCVSQKNLPKYYTSCDVFCFCGPTQCLGSSSASLSVIEAESCGVPVLRTKGNTDEVVDGKTGLYFSSESSLAMARTILSFMHLPQKKLAEFKKRARLHVLTHFSWDSSSSIVQSLI